MDGLFNNVVKRARVVALPGAPIIFMVAVRREDGEGGNDCREDGGGSDDNGIARTRRGGDCGEVVLMEDCRRRWRRQLGRVMLGISEIVRG